MTMQIPGDPTPGHPSEPVSGIPKPLGPYSPAVRAGNLVFLSGQTPVDTTTGELIEGSVAEQTAQVLRNLEAVLHSVGGSWPSVVKTTVFLRDMGDFQEMNAAYAAHLGTVRPARSTVAVAGLPRDARVEIEAVAYLPEGER
jgi:2-iminobutanoate/2-iminopropanoate deaminase